MSRRVMSAVALAVALTLAGATLAGAAKVENGGFETGSLSGWTQVNSPAGEWIAYDEAFVGMSTFPAPPEGEFAALTNQSEVSYQVLYQDVKLKPGKVHELGFTTYYFNEAGGFITPDNLSVTANENQQYTADVLRKGADPRSLLPGDVLLPLFRTEVGDPDELDPTQVKADLSPFGGGKVRLRFGVAVTEEVLNAGLDDVALTSKKAPKCSGEKPTIVGTNGKDKIKGTKKDDVIVGRGGKDKIKGKGGEDVLCGNGGKDSLNGGGGGDFCDPGGGPGRVKACEI